MKFCINLIGILQYIFVDTSRFTTTIRFLVFEGLDWLLDACGYDNTDTFRAFASDLVFRIASKLTIRLFYNRNPIPEIWRKMILIAIQ